MRNDTSGSAPPGGERLLTSFAILKSNWDEGRTSYMDYFLPFVAHCLRAWDHSAIDAIQLGDELLSTFGIPLPKGVSRRLLRKAARSGLGRLSNNSFMIDSSAVSGHDLSQTRTAAMRRHEALVERLVQFAKEQHGLQLSRDQGEALLLAHLDAHSTSILRTILRGGSYQPTLGPEASEYVVSTFVAHTFARDPEGFDYLESAVKGLMLASVLYLPDPADVARRFDRVTFILDTRLILQALGYEGPQAETAIRTTLELSYQLGASLAAFEDTISETRGVLLAISANLNRVARPATRKRSTEQWFLTNGYTPSDVALLAERLEDDLRGLRIATIERPPPIISLTTDEIELETQLQERLHYQSRSALLHDLDALTAIYRMRGGQRFTIIERSRAIFVTTNAPLASIGRYFFYADDISSVPVALTDDDLTTLVWLKKPLDAPDLPRARIMADCYAALEPGDELWAKYLSEVDRLKERNAITEEDYFLLRYSLDAQDALMHRTLATPERVSAASVEQVLQDAKASIRQLDAHRVKEAEASLDGASRSLTEAGARIRAAEQKAAAAEERAIRAEQANAQATMRRRGYARNKAMRRATFARRTLLAIFALLVGALAYFSLPAALALPPQEISQGVRVPLRFALLATAGFVAWCQVTGKSPLVLARSFEVRLARRLEQAILQQDGFDAVDSNVDGAAALDHSRPDDPG